jgi:arylsulfatase A-like enzyme
MPGCSGTSAPRLVVLIVIDTLRADRLGCYGALTVETPALDALSREGVLYENAVTSVPLTLPSVATLLTGVYPLQHGIRDNGPFALDEAWTTLAERFREAGCATAAFVSADVLSRDHGLAQGFDLYDDDLSAAFEVYDPQLLPFRESRQGVERRADATVDRVLEWAQAHGGERAFLLVHFFDPHLPRDPVPEFRARYPGRPYDAEVACTDRECGRMLAGLRAHWRPREILTLVVADHGEGLQDHEEEFHGYLLFEETMRVPMILHGPGVPRAVRCRDLARTIDVAPTLCALAGLAPLPGCSGVTLPESGGAPAPAVERLAYMETFRPRWEQGWCELRGLRTQRWKLIAGPALELYELVADPGERRDLGVDAAARTDSLARLMEVEAQAALARGARAAVGLTFSDAQRERLHSLGYVAAAAPAATPADSLAIALYAASERGAALGLPHPRTRLAAYNRRIQARSLDEAGRRALDRGDAAEAHRCFTRAIGADSSYVDPRLGLARAFQATGDVERALRELRRARRSFPGDPAVAAALTEAMRGAGRPTEAQGIRRQREPQDHR